MVVFFPQAGYNMLIIVLDTPVHMLVNANTISANNVTVTQCIQTCSIVSCCSEQTPEWGRNGI